MALKNRKDEFRGCYENEVPKSPKRPTGRGVADFTVDESGEVTHTAIKETTLKQPKVEACVLKTIESIQFPARESGGSTLVSYPFNFNRE